MRVPAAVGPLFFWTGPWQRIVSVSVPNRAPALAWVIAIAIVYCRVAVAQQPAGSNFVNNGDMGRAVPIEVLWEGVEKQVRVVCQS